MIVKVLKHCVLIFFRVIILPLIFSDSDRVDWKGSLLAEKKNESEITFELI